VDKRLEDARYAARVVERFSLGLVSEAEEDTPEATEAQNTLRLAVGLRRKLDNISARESLEHLAR
jgi:hypothetical protein